MKKQRIKKPFYKRWWFIAIIVIAIAGAFTDTDDTDKKEEKPAVSKKVDEKEKPKKEKPKEENLKITGDLKIEFKDNKAIATITTNAIDGSVFETSIIDSKLNMVSDFISVKDGKAIKEFEVNKEWEPGYLSGIAGMRFNLDDHPQPEEVRKLYGENGEKLKGDFIQENNEEGYNINLKNKTVPYPDEATAKAKQDELFNKAITELIEASEGIIIDIRPRFEKEDWSAVSVTVSDVWYNSQEHEKERFAEQVGDTVSTLVTNGGKVEQNKPVLVYIMDTYNKELASPKITGGYKIKK
ncbi:hypothetical protein [Tissierella creatinophila]|uniref:Uncharacterized protein n=1 Tax=Tissierella creatinophila DSM 6911 TaxID=1123403 RepID=A0A1U7M522_TISCR|nr:hypothetical protein [Tissierella creatinophila]OLS02413.1 hypothetical protein TICRE_16020 [Tissierella creatinophila DSM 6911]